MTQREDQLRWRAAAPWALPWLAAALSCWPLAHGGFPQGHDWSLELVRVAEYQAALAAGQLPPYWGENLYAGYGSPVFLFYAPLFVFGASALAWLVGSIATGSTLFIILLSLLSVPALRVLLAAAVAPCRVPTADSEPSRRALRGMAVRVGLTLFLLHPYLLADKLLRNANAEFAALCLMPLALAGVLYADQRPRTAFGLLSGGLAASILAHNLTALVTLAFVLGVAFTLYPPWRRLRPWVVIVGAIGFGLGLACFFWYPAMSMLSLIRPEELLRGKFDFHAHFSDLRTVLGYGTFYSSGLPSTLALGTGLVVVVSSARQSCGSRGRRRRILAASLAAALCMLFLISALSTKLWEASPLLPLFQFPWRFVGPLALLTAMVATCSLAWIGADWRPSTRVALELVLWLLCVVNALPTLMAYRPLSPETTRKLPVLLSAEFIRNGTQSVSVLDEYLPRAARRETWKQQRPMDGPVVSLRGDAEVEVLQNGGTQMVLDVVAHQSSRLRIARWAFPGWRFELDDRRMPFAMNPAGSLGLDVPPGRHRLRLSLDPPLQRRRGVAVSLLTLPVWLLLVAGRPVALWRKFG